MGPDNLYIQHILESIGKIEKFLIDITEKDFRENELLQSGVLRELGVIGEAARKLSKEYKNAHSAVPWKDIIGMRDKLIHDYFEIDVGAVWKTAVEDLGLLKKELHNS